MVWYGGPTGIVSNKQHLHGIRRDGESEEGHILGMQHKETRRQDRRGQKLAVYGDLVGIVN
jgi:hypothetical protein